MRIKSGIPFALSFAWRFKRDERGVQLAELSIVIVLLLVLLAAASEFGRYFHEYTTLAKATRTGARYLITSAVNPAEDTRAKNLVVYGNTTGTGQPVLSGLTVSNVVITRSGGVPKLPQTVTVQITGYRHRTVFDLGRLIRSNTFTMNIEVRPSVTMRYLLTQPPV